MYERIDKVISGNAYEVLLSFLLLSVCVGLVAATITRITERNDGDDDEDDV